MASVSTSRSPRVARRGPILARLRAVGGFLLIVVGLVGLLVPVIPGIPLLLAGTAVLGRDHPLVRPVLGWLRRFPLPWRARGR